MDVLTPDLYSRVRDEAALLGFDHCALARPRINARDRDAYRDWVDGGRAAGMEYMRAHAAERADPECAFPGVRSVLTLGISYFQGPFPPKPGPGFGRVARYAWGRDYHPIILDRLRLLAARLRVFLGEEGVSVPAVDTKPILERALAANAGLGFVGKNAMLISGRSTLAQGPRFHVGSWIFLAELFLTLEAPDELLPAAAASGCGGCTRCLTACPTDAFDGAYRLDAGRCIAYLTIENKGWIPREMRPAIGDWVFGCDVCQEVCPFNARAIESRWPEFSPDEGAGAWVSLETVLRTPDAPAFRARWGHTPLSRPKRKGLLRNACVAAGNSGDASLAAPLRSLLEDSEPVIRGHALWALARLGIRRDVGPAAERLRSDPDAEVRVEAEAVLAAAS